MSRQNTKVKVDAVTDLCIQIQPHRAPDLDVAAVRNRCEALASKETVIERFAVVEGPDEVAYIRAFSNHMESRGIPKLAMM